MDVPLMRTVRLRFGEALVTAPHPALFALHKLLVVPRRRNAEKKEKDLAAAFSILALIEKKGEMPVLREFLGRFPLPWKKSLVRTLRANRGDAWIEAIGLE
jgi:hypothetical protein